VAAVYSGDGRSAVIDCSSALLMCDGPYVPSHLLFDCGGLYVPSPLLFDVRWLYVPSPLLFDVRCAVRTVTSVV